MADVFLSYARPSAGTAKSVAAKLREQDFSVWLDEHLPAHRAYADVIAAELDLARAVIVIWSEAAAQSQWVRSEANRAREKGALIQLRLDDARLPMPFDQIQCADLQGWAGDERSPGWSTVVDSVAALVRGDRPAAPTRTPVAAAQPSIAVLALKDLSATRDQDYFCEGIAEEIVTALARLPGLRVAATAGSAASERPLAARDIARLLEVRSFLEGSIRKVADRARITVRLVATDTGFTLWSETFERELADIFAVQDEIARAIVAALGVTLLAKDSAALGAGGSSDAKAYDLYLQARHLVRKELEVERQAAADLFREATRRDPGFALALAGLADVLAQTARWKQPGWDKIAREALEAADRAVALAPALAEAHVAQGAALRLGGDRRARDSYMRALALSPHEASVHYRVARFLVLEGDKVGAVRHYERAFELAPDDYRYIVFALQEYQALGDAAGERSCLARAWQAIERHLELNPDDVRALGHGAGVQALLGRREDAQRAIDRAAMLRPDDYGNLATLACAAALNQDQEQALDLLEQAVATGRGDREWILSDNDLAPLHGHSRFKELIGRMP